MPRRMANDKSLQQLPKFEVFAACNSKQVLSDACALKLPTVGTLASIVGVVTSFLFG